MRKIIGIDLGTTYSAVAAMKGDNPQMIVNAEGVAPPLRANSQNPPQKQTKE